MTPDARRSINTPTGPFTVAQKGDAIVAASWAGGHAYDDTALLLEAERQILEYFEGERVHFELAVEVQASDTQKRICEAIAAIPFGETRTYGDLARDLGLPPQAVGRGCGGNPVPLIIPCHRVLGANGLGGFSGGMGVETKVALLKHEGAASLLI